ncbi:MAG: RNA polymerase sigma factor, partial [Acidimicrobiia bacterium]|nr:RNA polymerase sigma factor [Acidimicrobiia bacterium]
MSETEELGRWLATSYASAYRTACLILHNPTDAEEAVQNAFLRVWRFRASVPADDGARRWLYRVLVNACCSKLRSERSRRTHAAPDELPDLPGPELSPETTVALAQTAEVVRDALASLPEHLRIPLVLRFYAGLSEREIATAIRRRPGTVKSRLHE